MLQLQLFTVIGGAVAYIFAKIVTTPIKYLGQQMSKVADGDLKIERINANTKDEVKS
ncbi:hypothetical protein KHA80_09425 [Anaerobacillus sp. HL2]|nr:hypothetical protein KHA80_09425 [Anaerobacillus sp. HL2]